MKKQTAFLKVFSGVMIILILFGMGSSANASGSTGKLVDAVSSPYGLDATQTGHVLVIPAAEFRSDGYVPNGGFFSFWGGYWMGDGTDTPCFMAPVYLPRVARIYQVWATTYDNDDIADLWLRLYRVDNYNGNVLVIADLFSSGASTSLVSLYDTSVSEEVSYPYYSYYLGTCLTSASHRIYNVRVWYSDYQTHLPLITR